MPEHKLDINAAMAAIDRRDANWLSDQPDDARDAFKPWPFMRHAATIADGPATERYLHAVNDRLNIDYAALAPHPDLLFRLAASIGTGTAQTHLFPDVARKRGGGGALREIVGRAYPAIGEAEIDVLLGLHTLASFTEFLADLGCDDKLRKEALTAYGTLKGIATSSTQ